MFPTGPTGTDHIGLQDPRWAGGGEGRVYGVEVVFFDDDDVELDRKYLPFKALEFYPRLSDLQDVVNQVNGGKRKRR